MSEMTKHSNIVQIIVNGWEVYLINFDLPETPKVDAVISDPERLAGLQGMLVEGTMLLHSGTATAQAAVLLGLIITGGKGALVTGKNEARTAMLVELSACLEMNPGYHQMIKRTDLHLRQTIAAGNN